MMIVRLWVMRMIHADGVLGTVIAQIVLTAEHQRPFGIVV